jgi:hypothetical protein
MMLKSIEKMNIINKFMINISKKSKRKIIKNFGDKDNLIQNHKVFHYTIMMLLNKN